MMPPASYSKLIENDRMNSYRSWFDTYGIPICTIFGIFLLASYYFPTDTAESIDLQLSSNFDAQEYEGPQAYVAMGATSNPTYLFPLPITVMAWKRLGVESLICFSGSESKYRENNATYMVIEMLEKLEVQMIFLETNKAPPHTVAQTCRMYLSASPNINITDDAIIVTSDTDLWAYHRRNHIPKEPKKMHLYNSECCKWTQKPNDTFRFRMYPMSTMGMSAKLWRDLLNVTDNWLTNGDVLAERLYDEFYVEYIRDGRPKPHYSSSWYADQLLMSEKIAKWKDLSHSNRASMSFTRRVVNRIDRIGWKGDRSSLNLKNHMDAHIFNHVHTTSRWRRTLPLLEKMFSPEIMQIIRDYRERFVQAIED